MPGDPSGFLAGAITSSAGTFTANPFDNAAGLANEAADFVQEQIELAVATRDEYFESANEVIAQLGSFNVDFDVDPEPPENPELEFDFEPDFGVVDPAALQDFGEISDPDFGSAPSTAGIGTVTAPTIPDFSPSITGLAIPEAPDPISIAVPGDPPATPGFEYPDAPTINLPSPPNLADVNIPTFDGITLPEFDPTFPTFSEQDPDTGFNWVEPTYTREIIDDVIAQVQTFLAGGSGVDPVVEEAIMARGRDREDRLVKQNEQQATDEWANRGYSAPPGMLVQRIDDIREEGLIKKLGLNRELVIKVHDDELTNLRFAVQQGIQAEQLFVQLFLAATERLFEAQRLTIQWMIDLYNIAVAVFNARMEEVRIRAAVYETQVRAALAEIEVFKALVDAERAKAEVNQSLVEAYTAEIEAQESIVNVYEAQIRAVATQAQVYATEIEAHKSIIESYAVQVQADKTRFDAYEDRVRGELGKASIIESEARAYQAEIEGIGTGVRANVATLQGQVSKVEADIRAYEADLRGKLGKAQIELNQIDSNVRGFVADVQRFSAEVGLLEARERTETTAWEAALRSKIAFFEAQIAKYGVDLQALTSEAELSLGSIEATGDLASTIIAGSMAAMHVGATLSGSGAVAASGNDSVSYGLNKSCGTNRSSSISYTADNLTEAELNCEF